MKTSVIEHDEAMIRSFERDPEYAEYYLDAVTADGDASEIASVNAWYSEARRRREHRALRLSPRPAAAMI